jgi:RNA polymerase-binding transcription factor DksA
MNEMRAGINFDRLTKRRAELLSTLQHLHKEQAEVERNTDWLDQAAYESRVALLDRLDGWYETEVSQIDRAIERIRRDGYGVCLACHRPIEPKRLAATPQVEYCSACQAMRETLTAA